MCVIHRSKRRGAVVLCAIACLSIYVLLDGFQRVNAHRPSTKNRLSAGRNVAGDVQTQDSNTERVNTGASSEEDQSLLKLYDVSTGFLTASDLLASAEKLKLNRVKIATWESLTSDPHRILPDFGEEHLLALEWASIYAFCNVERFASSRSVAINRVSRIIRSIDSGETTSSAQAKSSVGIPVAGFAIVEDANRLSLALIESIDYRIETFVVVLNAVDPDLLRAGEEVRSILKSKAEEGLIGRFVIREFPYQIGCSGYWNQIIFENPAAEYWLLLNNDVVFERNGLKSTHELIMASKKAGERLQTFHLSAIKTWSAFAVTREGIAERGMFDENIFPAYYEDTDFHYRKLPLESKVSERPYITHIPGTGTGQARLSDNLFHSGLKKMKIAADNAAFFSNKYGTPGTEPDGSISRNEGTMGNVEIRHPYKFPYNNSAWRNHLTLLVDPLRRLCLYTTMNKSSVPPGLCLNSYLDGFLWQRQKVLGVRSIDDAQVVEMEEEVRKLYAVQKRMEKVCIKEFLGIENPFV